MGLLNVDELEYSETGEDHVTEGSAIFPTLTICGPQESAGVAGHPDACTPCTFFCYTKKGCNKGAECMYCHYSHHSKLRQRREDWKRAQREKRRSSRMLKAAQEDDMRPCNSSGEVPTTHTSTRNPASNRSEHDTATVFNNKANVSRSAVASRWRPTLAGGEVSGLSEMQLQQRLSKGLRPPHKGDGPRDARRSNKSSSMEVLPDGSQMTLHSAMRYLVQMQQQLQVGLVFQCPAVFRFQPGSICVIQHQHLLVEPIVEAPLSNFRVEGGVLPRGLRIDSQTGTVHGVIMDGYPRTERLTIAADLADGAFVLHASLQVEVVNFFQSNNPGADFVLGHIEEVRQGIFMLVYCNSGEDPKAVGNQVGVAPSCSSRQVSARTPQGMQQDDVHCAKMLDCQPTGWPCSPMGAQHEQRITL